MVPRVRISGSKTVIESDPTGDAELAGQFAERKCLVLDDIFEPDVIAILARLRAEMTLVPDLIAADGGRLREEPPRIGQMLSMLLRRPALCAWLERITGVTPLRGVRGVIGQLDPGGQYLGWHNDMNEPQRKLGVTVNLSEHPYDGGRFEMKWKDADELLLAFDHRRFATALVFFIDKQLFHRVTPVTAGGPRIVFAGWFVADAQHRP